jgi:hypothetical protein
MNALLRFKTSTLTAYGFQRNGIWNGEYGSAPASAPSPR